VAAEQGCERRSRTLPDVSEGSEMLARQGNGSLRALEREIPRDEPMPETVSGVRARLAELGSWRARVRICRQLVNLHVSPL
jgi:hypothetical protein